MAYFYDMILITGGTGLVGAYLIEQLLKENQSLRVLYRTAKKREQLLAFLERKGITKTQIHLLEFVQGDLDSAADLFEVTKSVQCVFHCAALISFDSRDRKHLFKINSNGTRDLVNAAIENKVSKFIYISSIAAMDQEQQTDYGKSKQLGELEVWRAGQEGVQTFIVRPGVILGSVPYTHPLRQLIRSVQNGISYRFPGSSGFIHIKTVVDCLLQLYRTESSIQHPLTLVSSNKSYNDVIEIINANLKRPAAKKEISKKWLVMLASIIENSSKLLGLKSSLTVNLVQTLFHKGKYETTSELAPFKQIKTPELKEMLDDLMESERYFPMV
ncbi:MAG: NAD-dependent epimerase/dehydratase family protein [Flavobacteriaceae bacterium]